MANDTKTKPKKDEVIEEKSKKLQKKNQHYISFILKDVDGVKKLCPMLMN